MVDLGNVLADIIAGFDPLFLSIEAKLLDRCAHELNRLDACEQSLRLIAHKNAQAHHDKQLQCEMWQREYEEVHTHWKKLQHRLHKEQQERSEEKEWLAQLWPDGCVLPTLLKPYELPEDDKSSLPIDQRRLQALVNRRIAKERVLLQIEASKHWKMMVVPATSARIGNDGVEVAAAPEQIYYMNAQTGESVWDPPAAMFYEPPPQWNQEKQDWKESYGLENFYPPNENETISPDQEKHKETVINDENEETESDDDEGDDPKDLDPLVCKELLTREMDKCQQLRKDVEQSEVKQRELALQVLNATRGAFEREKEELTREDDELKAIERKKRKALLQEQAAAKAAADAQQKKQDTSGSLHHLKFARDSIAKKDMTLAKDDELFEKELDEFVHQQRADRLYLTTPLSTDPRVQKHHQLDEEYVHMKHMEAQVLAIDQYEFDLLEKSALRHEEANTKKEELEALCDQIRTAQVETTQNIIDVEKDIARLEILLPPPKDPRPTQEELANASERYVTLNAQDNEDEEAGDDEGKDSDTAHASDSGGDLIKRRSTITIPSSILPPTDSTQESSPSVDDAAFLKDEAELLQYKRFVDAEQNWRDWEREEAMRLQELAQAVDRLNSLETTRKQLTVDLALYEGDARFFARLSDLEKDANTRMWRIQGDSQVERVRFMVERAAREESVYQIKDRLEQIYQELEQARRLPLQALNPIERLELEAQSRMQCQTLSAQIKTLQARYAKEMEAKTLLIEMETRSCRYAHEKLQEEGKLFAEKQALWDLNFTLEDELQNTRKTIERLYILMEGRQKHSDGQEVGEGNDHDRGNLAQFHEEATSVFEAKLQYLQQVRQFLFSCYDREARWRSLASIALVKDCSSNEWMTMMQRERQEEILALLQQQHAESVVKLEQEIKLLKKVEAMLRDQIHDLNAKAERLQRAYQASSDGVLQETQNVILVLKADLQTQKELLVEEQKHALAERERLIQEHSVIRNDLEERLQQHEQVNDKQRHWLTAAKRELHATRVANEELLKAYQSLEKRRATETNDMRFRISSQIKKINNIEMWNLSLKHKAKEANVERVKMQQQIDRLVEQHMQQQRQLHLRNWKHQVTAQAILTNVDHLFAFFADGVAILAGATPETNAALRSNGGIEVLAALAQHSYQQSIKIACAKALGQLAWNENSTARSLGWQAKRTWFKWVQTQSNAVLATIKAQNISFDSIADEQSADINWLSDTSALRDGEGESDLQAVAKHVKKIQFIKTWQQFHDKIRPDTNIENQEYMGLSSSILKTIITLCRGPSDNEPENDPQKLLEQKQIQRNALLSLSLIVMNTRNTSIVGRLDGAIPLLVELIAPKIPREDTHVLRNAIHALANLAFQNKFNQQMICKHCAIPSLLLYCEEHTDIDVIFASIQALANLSHDETSVCEAIFNSKGIVILMRLCNSTRIYDTIDLNVYEEIQNQAAEVITNVIVLLDKEDNESNYRAWNVANVILELEDTTKHNQDFQNGPRQRVSGIATFINMCASCNRNVAFHGALVIGTIAQYDEIRAAIGSAGGIDALFLLVHQLADKEIVVQATWALANLTWNRENQYRVTRYLDVLYQLCMLTPSSTHTQANQEDANEEQLAPEDDAIEDEASVAQQIREHALCIVANSLFYNDDNRNLLASQPKWLGLILRICMHGDGHSLEHSARALCALSYSDSIALMLGGRAKSSEFNGLPYNGLQAFIRLCGYAANPVVQKNGLSGVINMCLHDANKTAMLDIPHGIETLVNISGHTNKELCDPAMEALELLADIRQLQQDGASNIRELATTDIKKLIDLLSHTSNPALIAMASDAIADQLWKKPSAKVKLRNEHGVEKLFELCVQPFDPSIPQNQQHKVLISCLWALRNNVADNVRNQDLVGALGGVQQLVMVYDRHRQHEDIVEAILAVLIALVMKHPMNSQELVQFGLDVLIGLADRNRIDSDAEEEQRRERTTLPPLLPNTSPKTQTNNNQRSSASSNELQNSNLARELLYLIAQYNNTSAAKPSSTSFSPERSKIKRIQQLQSSSHHNQQPQSQHHH